MYPWTAALCTAATLLMWLARYVVAAVAATVLSSAVPSDPPTCWVVLTSALATPASLGSTPIERRAAHGDEGHPHAEADEDLGREDVDEVGAVHRQSREPQEPAGGQRQSGHHEGPGADTRAGGGWRGPRR